MSEAQSASTEINGPSAVGMTPDKHVQDQISLGLDYSRASRRRFSIGAIGIRLMSLVMTGAATVTLGFSDLTTELAFAFTLTALVTLLNALEPLFNFRSRWIAAEETLGDFHRLNSELDFRRASTSGDLPDELVEQLHNEVQDTWKRMSDSWASERKRAHQ